ncbi:metallophosphoesterase [uncultured Aliiroseovarius sp.]|uniref:metallophosphoesterase n=1 Tax=uncultured Aliiroseovarius sp. TaxID=1658783 RepID=UPI0026322770|nr:metallophosphoesterase [uncultured Aliiroseovarius sp.]
MKLLRRPIASTDQFPVQTLAPEVPFCVVGDVHGRADLLERIEDHIVRHYPGVITVFVGDYIDRGEDSARTLNLLASGSDSGSQPVVCLRGNHEEMLLSFLDDPVGSGRHWLQHGGLQTLASFGVSWVAPTSPDDALCFTRDTLARCMGADLIDWLRARPALWQTGNVAVAHAGADPSRPFAAQSEANLIWGHPSFRRSPRKDGIWVAHGHIAHETAHHRAGRIAVDTGAFATGLLSGAFIAPGHIEFFSTNVTQP